MDVDFKMLEIKKWKKWGEEILCFSFSKQISPILFPFSFFSLFTFFAFFFLFPPTLLVAKSSAIEPGATIKPSPNQQGWELTLSMQLPACRKGQNWFYLSTLCFQSVNFKILNFSSFWKYRTFVRATTWR